MKTVFIRNQIFFTKVLFSATVSRGTISSLFAKTELKLLCLQENFNDRN